MRAAVEHMKTGHHSHRKLHWLLGSMSTVRQDEADEFSSESVR